MRVYVVVDEWMVDGDCGRCVYVYTNFKTAKQKMDQLRDEAIKVREEDGIDCRQTDYNNQTMTWEQWEDGDWGSNHDSIVIYEESVEETL